MRVTAIFVAAAIVGLLAPSAEAGCGAGSACFTFKSTAGTVAGTLLLDPAAPASSSCQQVPLPAGTAVCWSMDPTPLGTCFNACWVCSQLYVFGASNGTTLVYELSTGPNSGCPGTVLYTSAPIAVPMAGTCAVTPIVVNFPNPTCSLIQPGDAIYIRITASANATLCVDQFNCWSTLCPLSVLQCSPTVTPTTPPPGTPTATWTVSPTLPATSSPTVSATATPTAPAATPSATPSIPSVPTPSVTPVATTTVTLPPLTGTVTPPPMTGTITPPPITGTVTPPPITGTITPPPVTGTITAPPATDTPSPTRTATQSLIGPPSFSHTRTATQSMIMGPSYSATWTPTATQTMMMAGSPTRTRTPTPTAATPSPTPAGPSPTRTAMPVPFSVFPNPVPLGGTLHFIGLPSGARVQLFNVRGELVAERTESAGRAVFAGEPSAAGAYVYRVFAGTNEAASGAIAVQ